MEPMPCSLACENNKWPILQTLQRVFTQPGLILEIGSGTGQHAEWFARHMPHLQWQPSDRPDDHETCRTRLNQAQLANVAPPLPLDVLHAQWPVRAADGIFSANTLHIMGWQAVEALFAGVAGLLVPGHSLCVYGPFNEHGHFTSDSNARFDAHLRAQDASMGLRDLDDLVTLGNSLGLDLTEQCPMPANNQLLIWRRI